MVAFTVFFLKELAAVEAHWQTSMNLGTLVTLVAAVHYFYLRELSVNIRTFLILYRYIDWSITVSLPMTEFYLILFAVMPDIEEGMDMRVFLDTVVMLAFGFLGEANSSIYVV